MKTLKQFILKAQKTKKCPPGYRFDEKLGVCVPMYSRGYPYLGGTSKTANGGNGSGNGGGNGGSSSGGGNG